jgi:hypothetical protein
MGALSPACNITAHKIRSVRSLDYETLDYESGRGAR